MSANAQFEQMDVYLNEGDDISIDDENVDDVSEAGDSYYSYDAEAEWEESKAQLNALFSLVVFPFVGRWFGKKFAFWLWSRYTPPTFLSSYFNNQWLHSLKQITSA